MNFSLALNNIEKPTKTLTPMTHTCMCTMLLKCSPVQLRLQNFKPHPSIKTQIKIKHMVQPESLQWSAVTADHWLNELL